MSRHDGILHLVLNAMPWDEIQAGRKPVEYRNIEKWSPRIYAPDGMIRFHTIRLQRAFQPINGSVPWIMYRIARIDIGPADPRWTYGIVPAGAEFLRIWLGNGVTL